MFFPHVDTTKIIFFVDRTVQEILLDGDGGCDRVKVIAPQQQTTMKLHEQRYDNYIGIRKYALSITVTFQLSLDRKNMKNVSIQSFVICPKLVRISNCIKRGADHALSIELLISHEISMSFSKYNNTV